MEFIDQNGCVGFFQRQQSPEENHTLQGGNVDSGSGAFAISIGEDFITFVNCYYNVGGVLTQANSSSIAIEDLSQGCIAAFCLPSQEVRIFGSINSLGEAQKKADEYVVALYVLNADGTVAADLRHAPQIQYFEEGLI